MDRSLGDESKDVIPSLLFALGYDVWMGSVRGSRYSITHETWDPRGTGADQYWNYNFETIARNDIPAMIKMINNQQFQELEDTRG